MVQGSEHRVVALAEAHAVTWHRPEPGTECMAPGVGQHLPSLTATSRSPRLALPPPCWAWLRARPRQCSKRKRRRTPITSPGTTTRHTKARGDGDGERGPQAPDVEVHGVGLKRCLTHARVTAQCICPPKERWSSGISPTSFRASSQPDQGPGCDPGTSGTHNWRPPRAVRRRAATAEATALRLPRPRLHADMRIVHMRTTAKNVPAGIGWYIASYQATALHRLLSQVRMAHIFGEPPPPKPRASAL